MYRDSLSQFCHFVHDFVVSNCIGFLYHNFAILYTYLSYQSVTLTNDNHSHLCNYGLWIINYRSPLDNDNHSHSPTQSIIILISVCKCKWQRLSLTFRFVNDNDNDYHLQGPQIHRRPRPRALGTGRNGMFARAIVCCDGLTGWRADGLTGRRADGLTGWRS